jgi:hypothetical protein
VTNNIEPAHIVCSFFFVCVDWPTTDMPTCDLIFFSFFEIRTRIKKTRIQKIELNIIKTNKKTKRK